MKTKHITEILHYSKFYKAGKAPRKNRCMFCFKFADFLYFSAKTSIEPQIVQRTVFKSFPLRIASKSASRPLGAGAGVGARSTERKSA